MATLNHISVEIEAKFGSAFQEEVAVRMLHKYINAWSAFFLEKHSKNEIEFRITNAEQITSTTRRTRSPKRRLAIDCPARAVASRRDSALLDHS